jgi:hypothetical protein
MTIQSFYLHLSAHVVCFCKAALRIVPFLSLLLSHAFSQQMTAWPTRFIKLRYTPPISGQAASLKVVDNWTPWTDQARSGAANGPPEKLAGTSLMSDEVKPVGAGMSLAMANARLEARKNAQNQPVLLVYPELSPGARTDQDLGSGGVVYIRDLKIVCGGGKDGLLYCMHADKMGGTKLNDLGNAHANCAKLVGGTPVWATMDPGHDIDPCPDDPRTLNFLPLGTPPIFMRLRWQCGIQFSTLGPCLYGARTSNCTNGPLARMHRRAT